LAVYILLQGWAVHGAWGNAKVTVHKGIIGLHHVLGGGGHFVFGFGKMKIIF
jgi:hypothetical protein